MRDLIVIGAGAAGTTAGIYASRKGLDVLMLTKDLVGQIGSSSVIENYPGFKKIRGSDLMIRFKEQLEDLGVEMKEEGVISVEEGFKVKAENIYEARAVIVASGSSSRHLSVPGEERFRDKGVSYCYICDGPLFKDEVVGVVGGGDSAYEAALELNDYCEKVFIFQREPSIAEEILQERVKESDVEIMSPVEVEEIKGGRMLESVLLSNGEEVELSGLFIEIGSVPVVDMVRDLVEVDGGIVTDRLGRTSVEGLFAAGDVTNFPYKQIIVASGQGAIASLSAYKYIKGI